MSYPCFAATSFLPLVFLVQLGACGGETTAAPPALTLPTASATLPLASAASPAPDAAPLPVAIQLIDPSVHVLVGSPTEVAIDIRALQLPPALRAHLVHQDRDHAAVLALAERRWDATSRAGACADGSCRNGAALEKAADEAQQRIERAVKLYEAWSGAALDELGAAADAPGATLDVRLAQAAFLQEDVRLHNYPPSAYPPACDRDLADDAVLHPCGEEQPRLAKAFTRAVQLWTPSSPSPLAGALAVRGMAQTVPAVEARAPLGGLLGTTRGAARGAVLAQLVLAHAGGGRPAWADAARWLRDLRDAHDEEARAVASKPPPVTPGKPRRPRGASRDRGMFGVAQGERFTDELGGPNLHFTGADAADALRMLVYVELHAGHRRECVQAAADLASRGSAIPAAIVDLVADAVEASDDVELTKAPPSLAIPVLEELATRALYRGDDIEASRRAMLAQKLGGATAARQILDAASRYASLPAEELPAQPVHFMFPDKLDTALTRRGGPERILASLMRLCLDPFVGANDLHACASFVVRPVGGHPALDMGPTAGLPSGVVECLRERAPRAFASTSYAIAAEIAIIRRSMDGAGGLGLSGVGEGGGGRGEGIGLGNFHGAGGGTGLAGPLPCAGAPAPDGGAP